MSATLLGATALSTRLSSEQLEVVRHVDSGAGHCIVRARAGTGKTFLILQCLPLMKGTIAILAYNTKISKEIRGKVAKAGHRGVDVLTFHALGDRSIRKMFPTAKLEGKGKGQAGYFKFDRIAEELNIPKYLIAFVKKTVGMAMLHGAGVPGLMSAKDLSAWEHLVKHYGIDTEIADDNVVVQLRGREALILDGLRFAHQALNLGKKIAHEVYSYDDMLWLPLILNAKLPTYDWICVDEAQDTNPVRRELARRTMTRNSRVMFVGDDRQSIYGFTGADSDALDIIERQFACKVLPMTMTFRCGKAIVELAQQIVPDYKAAPNNPAGLVQSMTEAEFAKTEMKPGQDAVICRNTRPLIKVAYGLIQRGVPAHIEGREIGKGLVSLISRFPTVKTIPALTDKLQDYLGRETDKLLKAGQDLMADAVADKVETVFAIMEGLPKGAKVDDLRARIDDMFADSEAGEKKQTVALLTAHRSKGLEYSRVFGLGVAAYMPSKRAKQTHEIVQEQNLEYVLKTRAIDTYVDVVVAG